MKNTLNKNLQRTIFFAALASSLVLTGCAGLAGSSTEKVTYEYLGKSKVVERHVSDEFTLSKLRDKNSPSVICLMQYKSKSYSSLPFNSIRKVINENKCDALQFSPESFQKLSGLPVDIYSISLSWDNKGEEIVCHATGGVKADLRKDEFLTLIAEDFLPNCQKIKVVHEDYNSLTEGK